LFEIFYHPEVISEDLRHINRDLLKRIKTAIENRLRRAPGDYGKPLRAELKSLWSLRVGDYRILYLIEDKNVIIIQVVHRKDAYQEGIAEARRRGLV
jgi:mRNA interferase RelE/StbE